MGRNDSTIRILKVLHIFETTNQYLKISDIHTKLNALNFCVTKKTVQRDVEALDLLGIPFKTKIKGKTIKWKIDRFVQLNQNVSFSYNEILALFVMRNSLDHLKGSPFYQNINSFFEKIEKILGPKCDAFKEFIENFSFRPQCTWHTSIPPIIIDTSYNALAEGHPLKINYRSEAGLKAGTYYERYVGPECLYFANGGVYLIGKDLNKNEFRTYSLARIREIEMDTNSIYEKEGINPDVLFKDAFGVFNSGEPEDVEIDVSGAIAAFVSERRWHNSQQVINTKTGIKLKFHVKINAEFIRWVLSLGDNAYVVKPESLKKGVYDVASKLMQQYQKPTSIKKAA